MKRKYVAGSAVFLLLVSLIGNGWLMFGKAGLTEERNRAALLADSVIAVKLMLDKEFDQATAKLATYAKENGEKDNTIKVLNEELAGIKLEVEKLLKDNAGVTALRKQLADMKKLRKACEEEVNKLIAENGSYSANIKELSEQNSMLLEQMKVLNLQLEQAKELKAYNIAVTGYKVKKSKAVPTVKAKRTGRITVVCDIMENKIAQAGKRTAYVVVTDPKGETLVMQGKKFLDKSTNGEKYYSASKEFDYKNSEQRLTVSFDYDNTLKSGKYKAELYVDGSYSGKREFILK